MMVTKEQIKRIMPYATEANIDKYHSALNYAMCRFGINTPLRQAHFLAQLAHESGSLRYAREIAGGEAYEGRKDLGNTHVGDGKRFKGRGLIQLTGRANYQMFNDYCRLNCIGNYDLIKSPEILEQPNLACLVAGWYWEQRNLNLWADRDDVVKVTKLINGGRNGLNERIDFLNRAKIILGWI